jgi:hypothetical protein
MPATESAGQARSVSNFRLRVTSGRCAASLWRRAKLGAKVSMSRAASGGVRRLSLQVGTMQGGGGRCLAWFGFAS